RNVEAALSERSPSPFREAFGRWILGSSRFIEPLRTETHPVATNPPAPEARQLAGLDPELICMTVSEFYGLDHPSLSRRHDFPMARAVAAWLCRRYSEAPRRLLAGRCGLARADSAPNLPR